MDIDKLLKELKDETTDKDIKNIIDAMGDLNVTNEDILKIFEEKGLISFNPILKHDKEN
jgi:DNA-binding transcriptional regulator YhcF (GntR family)